MKSCRVSFGNAVNARIFQPAKNACWNVLVGRFLCRTAALLAIAHLASNLLQAEEPAFGERERNLLRTFCVDCHGNEEPKAHLNLQELTDVPDEIRRFRVWEKVASVIAERRMPPGESDQPSDGQRRTMVFGIREHLDDVAQLQAGQPGRVTLRRLSSAEYAYSIEDLTGTQFDLDRILIGDAVGGEGFTNVGDVQFVQDSTIERYLEAAKLVASRAVIGAGPLIFADDAGPTGQELSAIRRIQAIYRKYGFRAAAGEGADSFGLEVYARAFFTVWRFENRVPLGEPLQTLDEIASEEGVPPRFASHIRRLVTSEGQSSPLRDIADEFRRLPTPSQNLDKESVASAARRGCDALFQSVRNWQRRLAPQVGDGEEAPLLANGKPALNPSVRFKTSCYWPVGSSEGSLVLQIRSAMDLDEQSKDAFIRWSNSRMQFVLADRKRTEPVPLLPKLKPESRAKLKMIGQYGSEPTEANTFVTEMGQSIRLEFAVPEGAISAIVSMEAALPEVVEGNPIIRCTVMNGWSQASTAADSGETSAIIGVPKGPAYERWLVGATEFAQSMPDASHREPAPSDRDPIPLPYDNTYNNPERNDFHYKIKYHRQDQFLVDALLDDVTRIQIDQAWADLLTSFDYHQTFLEFIGGKYSLDLGPRRIGALDAAWLEAVPLEAREYVEKLQLSYHDAHQRLEIGFAGHLVDLLRFADRAWRRPLTDTEQAELREFYGFARTQLHLDHVTAVRAVIMRILVAPAYLYRLEPRHEPSRVSELTAQELASRLSLFLWSSLPDDELRKAALEGRLKTPEEIELHARRMARDPKARRFASEFFCQWFGIYRFQEYTGVDTQRFPEFDARLRASMQEEAVAFFEYLIRENRPADEILFAEYSFWNRQLAEHYGTAQEELEGLGADFKQMGNLTRFRRGGLLGLAAIQTVTSAPLRTSPVKRGDWILRRVLGTPVPPPPADAGSIPADDLLPDGQSALDRLIAHRKNATCVNCHARMDPLGFALENFDPIGRWREAYRDGRPVETSGTLSDGTAIEGPDGLREYLQSNRLSFRRTLCVKMLGYALGRSELLTDRALIEQMMVDLEHGGTVVDLAVRVSTSPQFRFRETHDSSEHSADGQHLKSDGGEDATNQ